MSDTYRVLVTGSRSWPSRDAVWERLAMLCAEELPGGGTLTVVHGDCPSGADRFARKWCVMADPFAGPTDIRVIQECHAADWDRFGKAAGFRRNAEMVALGADLVLAFPWPGDRKLSRGTWHCIDAARKAGLIVEIVAPAGPRFNFAEVAAARKAAQA